MGLCVADAVATFRRFYALEQQARAASLPREGPLRDNDEIWAARFLHAAIIWAEVDFIPQDYSLPPSASPRTHRGHVFVTHPEWRAALQRSRG